MGEPSTSILSAGSILNGIGTNLVAGGNPITGAMLNASALAASGGGGFGSGGGSLFGFETPFSGIGRFIDPITSTPIFGRDGMISNIGQAAGAYNQFGQALGLGQQPRMQGIGAATRQGAQIQPIDYMSLLNPQQQTVIRPATPSLI